MKPCPHAAEEERRHQPGGGDYQMVVRKDAKNLSQNRRKTNGWCPHKMSGHKQYHESVENSRKENVSLSGNERLQQKATAPGNTSTIEQITLF